MKLNLGSGNDKREGYTNVDNSLLFGPDEVVDLNSAWPWPDNSIDEVVARHVLEHLRLRPTDVMRNIYRVLKPGAKAIVTVPHPRSDAYLNDPTHCMPYMPGTFEFFSEDINRHWMTMKWPNTPLALMLGVNFKIENITVVLTPPWSQKVGTDAVKAAEAVAMYNNVCSEFTVTLSKESVAGASVRA